MELKLKDPNNTDFVEALVGIKRAEEISKALDEMVKSYNKITQLVYLKDTIQDIAFICNNETELAYGIVLHMGYLQQKGVIITPRK